MLSVYFRLSLVFVVIIVLLLYILRVTFSFRGSDIVFIFIRIKKGEDQGKEGVTLHYDDHKRMKRGSGMKDRDERSRVIEILRYGNICFYYNRIKKDEGQGSREVIVYYY